jgi:hypothetical protein
MPSSAIADQLLGDHTMHAQIRKAALDFMEGHREDFEPFVVDTPFKKYGPSACLMYALAASALGVHRVSICLSFCVCRCVSV